MNATMEPKEITGGIENAPGLKHHDLKVCGGPMSVYEAGIQGRPVSRFNLGFAIFSLCCIV